MAAPFTPFQSFTDNATPITSNFLNAIQGALAASAFAGYGRVAATAWSDDGSTLRFANVAPFLALDSVSQKYVGVAPAAGILISSGFSAGAWNYVYARVSSGVVAYTVSTDAPDNTLRFKNGDETSRYLCAVFVGSGGALRRFSARAGRYQFQEKVILVGSDFGAAAGATTWQTVTLSGTVSLPVTATTILISAWAVSTNSGSTQAYLRGSTSNADLSSSGAPSLLLAQTGSSSTPATADDDFEFTTSGSFQWCTSSASGMSFRAIYRGFTE